MVASVAGADLVAPILEKLKGVQGRGPWTALCPAHDDGHNSLSIGFGKDGRVLLNCHAHCTFEAIVAALGITASALHPNGGTKEARDARPAHGVTTRAKLVKTYDYQDADGSLLFQVCRFDPKDFRQRRPDGHGNWIWGLGDVEPVLYRLPELFDALAHERTIYVVEGEKDVESLVALGLDATTSPMGGGKWRESYSEPFSGASVVMLPDNDDTGRSHAQQVAASLTNAGATVRVVSLPKLPKKGDASDWIAAGGTREQLEQFVAAAPVWTIEAITGAKRTRWRLDELLKDETIMRPPPIVVPRLAWQGRSTLLAAREKAGKSTLIGYMAAQVSRGGEFLDGPCAFGDVLLIGLEEFVGDAARRLRDFRANPVAVHVVIGFLGDPRERPQELADHIDATQPTLVILDSLAAYGQGQIDDDNSAAQMGAVVQPLTDVAHSRNIALVIAHHARKSDGRARGSTAITAGVDVVAEMIVPDDMDTDPTLRRMHTVGRVPVQRQYDLRFNGQMYQLADGVVLPLEERIVAVIRERPGSSRRDVIEAVGGNATKALNIISDLLAKRIVIDQGSSATRSKLMLRAESIGPELLETGQNVH